VLRRGVARLAVTWAARALLVRLVGRVRARRQAVLPVRPETLLRRHRAGFRAPWRQKSRPGPGRPLLAAEAVAPIRRMTTDNPLWGAGRIRSKWGKLGIRAAKRTIRTCVPNARAPHPRGQSRATFSRDHGHETRACDLLQVADHCSRPMFKYVVIALGSRRVIHLSVTRHPTDAQVARQRRECLDHLLVLGERHLRRVLREYVAYCNREQPHRGSGQATPERSPGPMGDHGAPVRAGPVLGGLHHAYQRAE